jgi:membrane associated rhomboid family serine protease
VIPLRDANPVRRAPVVTVGLIVACVVVFAYTLGIETNELGGSVGDFFDTYGVVPAQLVAAWSAGQFLGSETLSVFTSMFLHGSLLHIAGNMVYLWIFGNNIEDRLGHVWFLLFYLAGGFVAAVAQVVVDPASEVPIVGASGAISAVLGAYLVLFPGARVLSLVFLGFFYQLIEVPAVLLLGFWFVYQLVLGVASLGMEGAEGGVAFFAHVGGFVAGVAVGLLLRGASAGRGRVSRLPPAGVG